MEVMKSSQVKYGSIAIEVVHDPSVALSVDNFDTHAFLTFKSAEDLLGWKKYSASEKIGSKQGKALQGEGFTPRKEFVTDSKGRKNEMGLIPFGLFHRVILWQSEKGNPNARALLAAATADSFRSIILEQVNSVPVPLGDRQRKIDSDRNAFYAQYAAGISDQEWLEQSGAGSMLGLDMGKTSHWVAFDSGYVPKFLSALITTGKDPDELLEEMNRKYE